MSAAERDRGEPPDQETPPISTYFEEPAAHGCVLVRSDPPATDKRAHLNGHNRQEAERRPDVDAKPSLVQQLVEFLGGEQVVTVEDFYSYMPMHNYIFTPTRELWPAGSVNAKCPPPCEDGTPVTKSVPRKVKGGKTTFETVPMLPTEYLDTARAVEQMTWAPGEPMVVRDKLVVGGGWIERTGCNTYNLYLPPRTILRGDPAAVTPWLDHIRHIFPENADHIVRWLAHRVQRPGEKINHALVLGGAQGIGKDSILQPVRDAIGPWNFMEVSPPQLLGRFNGFVKSVILRVSEARDLGDIDRYAFYEHMKVYTAAPPEVLRCDEKNLREHSVMNVCGIIITSNHKTDGIYLPADDRRHYVAWSDLERKDFPEHYFPALQSWYRTGGIGHVAAYLSALDLSGFDPKAPPPKTAAFWDIVDASRAPEDAELADTLDKLQRPPAVTITDITVYADESFQEWLQDRRNRRQIPHRMQAAGYVTVRNDADKHDGQWKVAGKRQTIYARIELTVRDRLAAAAALCRSSR